MGNEQMMVQSRSSRCFNNQPDAVLPSSLVTKSDFPKESMFRPTPGGIPTTSNDGEAAICRFRSSCNQLDIACHKRPKDTKINATKVRKKAPKKLCTMSLDGDNAICNTTPTKNIEMCLLGKSKNCGECINDLGERVLLPQNRDSVIAISQLVVFPTHLKHMRKSHWDHFPKDPGVKIPKIFELPPPRKCVWFWGNSEIPKCQQKSYEKN